MTSVRVKLCGIRSINDVSAAARVGADYIGLIGVAQSRRFVEVRDALNLAREARVLGMQSVRIITSDEVRAGAGKGFDILQVVGDVSPKLVSESGAREHWLVQPVGEGNTDTLSVALERMHQLQDYSKIRVHFDSASPLGGGSGRRFDPQALLNFVGSEVIGNAVYAGGLDEDSVRGVLRICTPYAVDVASGIEVDGLPSAKRMGLFVQAVRDGQRHVYSAGGGA